MSDFVPGQHADGFSGWSEDRQRAYVQEMLAFSKANPTIDDEEVTPHPESVAAPPIPQHEIEDGSFTNSNTMKYHTMKYMGAIILVVAVCYGAWYLLSEYWPQILIGSLLVLGAWVKLTGRGSNDGDHRQDTRSSAAPALANKVGKPIGDQGRYHVEAMINRSGFMKLTAPSGQKAWAIDAAKRAIASKLNQPYEAVIVVDENGRTVWSA